MKPTNKKDLEIVRRAAELIASASYVIVFSGAGISTPSGIPDFRSPRTGLWNQSDPLKVASIWAFQHSPKDFFDWIRPLAINSENAKPNAAHQSLANLEKAGIIKTIITQNIDGLHQKSGSKNVLELHGTAQTASCPACGKKHERTYFHRTLAQGSEFPRCSQCNCIIKPDVVLFGESLPQKIWNQAYLECMKADLILVVGSSLEVSPANSLPELAVNNGSKLIINNLEDTFLDSRAALIMKLDVELGVGLLDQILLEL